jgi:hypothetical protein
MIVSPRRSQAAEPSTAADGGPAALHGAVAPSAVGAGSAPAAEQERSADALMHWGCHSVPRCHVMDCLDEQFPCMQATGWQWQQTTMILVVAEHRDTRRIWRAIKLLT